MTTKHESVTIHVDVQQTPDASQAQQQAATELGKSKYHVQTSPQHTVTSLPTIGAPTPTTAATIPPPPPPPKPTTASDSTVILVIIGSILVVLLLVFVLRALGKPRTKDRKPKEKKDKTTSSPGTGEQPAFDEVLYGAALHRRTAQTAADSGRWDEAIRERFRAVISALDELGLLPERPERTADEAARDAGELLPEHFLALTAAARAFDEVEYGEYIGSPDAYAGICAVDEQIVAFAATGGPGARR